MEKEAIQRILKGSRSGSKQPKMAKEDRKQRVSMLGIFKMGNFRKMVFMLMLFKDMKENTRMGLRKDMASISLATKSISEILSTIFMKGKVSFLLELMYMLEALKMDLNLDTARCRELCNLMDFGKITNPKYQ